jgi:hypothetical protein
MRSQASDAAPRSMTSETVMARRAVTKRGDVQETDGRGEMKPGLGGVSYRPDGCQNLVGSHSDRQDGRLLRHMDNIPVGKRSWGCLTGTAAGHNG